MLGRDIFDGVGFVEDDRVVRREHAEALSPQREVSEEHRVIDHENVRVLHPPTCGLVEALVVRRAALTHAVFTVGLDLVPNRGAFQLWQRGERTIVGPLGPVEDLLQGTELFGLVEERRLSIPCTLGPAEGDVVAPALDEHGTELDGQHRLQERHILVDDLLLERDGVRGDDDPAFLVFVFLKLGDVLDRRQQIAEGFAHSGACFNDELVALLQRVGDGSDHLLLLGALLEVVAHSVGDRSIGAKDVREVEGHGAIVEDGCVGRRRATPGGQVLYRFDPRVLRGGYRVHLNHARLPHRPGLYLLQDRRRRDPLPQVV